MLLPSRLALRGYMQHPFMVVLIISGIFFLPTGSLGSDPGALIETYDEGWINWTRGVVMAQGVGAPVQKKTDDAQTRKTAVQAAHQNGWQNLFAAAKRVRITATSTVADLAAKDDAIRFKLEEMARAAEITKQEYLSDGTVAVTLQLSLYGGFAQMLLPFDIEQIETIKAGTADNQMTSGHALPKGPASQTSDIYTGLVVDTRGLAVRPVLAPSIVDENGQEVYGPGIVSREFAVQHGVSGYTRDLETAQKAKRVLSTPLTVKALRINGQARTHIVIGNTAAAKLRSSFEHLNFLKECRVVIVIE